MSKQETGIPEAYTKFIHSWFDGLRLRRDDPKSKYPSNIRYQNLCAKIELVQEELALYDKKSSTSNQSGGISKTGPCSNKMPISNDRITLIAHIQRILPEIRQHLA